MGAMPDGSLKGPRKPAAEGPVANNQKIQIEDELLTVREVARLLKVPPSWVYERCRERSSDPLPHLKLGKYLRFYKSELLHYMEKLRRGSSNTGLRSHE
jgi:excisionase family DNA binding protein